MNPRPLTMPADQRDLLLRLERLHEEWRVAIEAADAIDCEAVAAQCKDEVQRLMAFRMAADRAHQQAMMLLRDAPI
jgi:hypothetical protein